MDGVCIQTKRRARTLSGSSGTVHYLSYEWKPGEHGSWANSLEFDRGSAGINCDFSLQSQIDCPYCTPAIYLPVGNAVANSESRITCLPIVGKRHFVARAPMFSAPQGPNIPAQGIALGSYQEDTV